MHSLQFIKAESINLGRLDGFENTGFILRFNFRLDEPLTSELKLLSISSSISLIVSLYLTFASNLFLFAYPSNHVDCGINVEVGKWYWIVLIVNLFDILKAEVIIRYDSVFIEKSSSMTFSVFSMLNFQFGHSVNND